MATWFRKNKQLVSTLQLWDNMYQEVLQNTFFLYDDLIINRRGNLFEKKTIKIGLYINTVGQYRCGGFVGYFFCQVGFVTNQENQTIGECINIVWHYIWVGLVGYFFLSCLFDK